MNTSVSPFVVRLPVDEFRSHPIPYSNPDGSKPKLGSCFVPVEALPEGLRDWMSVNPRVPQLGAKSETLKGPVAKAIVDTLLERPDMMCLMNNGVTLLVQKMEHNKGTGGKGELSLTFSDPQVHGVPNGGHTLAAIFQVADDNDRPEPWPAMVRLHIYEGLAPDVIPAMAEGLNRSMQVDTKSLENLKGMFEKIKIALHGKQGCDQIAYRQGDTEPVDVQFVLQLMACLNINKFPDRKTHPNSYFGQVAKVLDDFVTDQAEGSGPKFYDRMLPRLHEILVLADEIQKLGVKELAKLKVKKAIGKNTGYVGNEAHKKRIAYFAGGHIEGYFPVGWLMPVLAAFRANVSQKAWEQGELQWVEDPTKLLKATIEEMCEVIRQEHTDNNSKPAEVGRKEAAYRGCYGITTLEINDK